jgi:hypothetical protein
MNQCVSASERVLVCAQVGGGGSCSLTHSLTRSPACSLGCVACPPLSCTARPGPRRPAAAHRRLGDVPRRLRRLLLADAGERVLLHLLPCAQCGGQDGMLLPAVLQRRRARLPGTAARAAVLRERPRRRCPVRIVPALPVGHRSLHRGTTPCRRPRAICICAQFRWLVSRLQAIVSVPFCCCTVLILFEWWNHS